MNAVLPNSNSSTPDDAVRVHPVLSNGIDQQKYQIDVIETMAEMETIRPQWESLHSRDPESNVFLSWKWLAQAFRNNPQRWRVFAVRSGNTYVCLFPTKYRVHWSNSRTEFQSEIEAGGRLIWSEYTGFLCDPAHQEKALSALANHLVSLPWSHLSLRYEDSKSRSAQFTSAFPAEGFSARLRKYRINKGQTDNLVSPQIELPGDFETYLRDFLSKSMREKVRRSFRRNLESNELRITETTPETFERDIEILLRFWTTKWAAKRGNSTAIRVAENYRKTLRAALDMNILFMPVLWREDQPLAALGHIIDTHQRRSHFIVSGRDAESDIASLGKLLHAYSIRWAIHSGLDVYDFCHGDERYKYSYGAKNKTLNYFTIRRIASNADIGSLDPINTAEALHRAVDFIDSGNLEKASAACRQILFDCI